MFLNNKKLPLIPPLLHTNRFISDFQHKAELSNDIFSNQCLLINNNSKLPTNLSQVTDRRLSPVTFSSGDIAKIIQNLNSNKVHGHVNISVRMWKICGQTSNQKFFRAGEVLLN